MGHAQQCSLALVAACALSCAVASADDEGVGLLDRYGTVVSFSAGGGRAVNVFLTPSNPVSGGFVEADLGLEFSHTLGDFVLLSLRAQADTRRYTKHTEANETACRLAGDVAMGSSDLSLVVTDVFDYDDYLLFDQDGDPLEEGPATSTANEASVGVNVAPWTDRGLWAGLLYRRENYRSLDFDYRDWGVDTGFRATVAPDTDVGLDVEYRSRSYDTLQSALADGTVFETNPVVHEDLFAVGVDMERVLPAGGEAGARLDCNLSGESFKGEGSYGEYGLEAHASVAIGLKLAVTAGASATRRLYMRRLVPGSDFLQRDSWIDASLLVEYAVWRTVSAFVSFSHEARVSNSEIFRYSSRTYTGGLRGVL